MGFPEILLKQECKELGITYNDLANKFNKPHGTIGGYMNGTVPMPPGLKQKIMEYIKDCKKSNTGAICERRGY